MAEPSARAKPSLTRVILGWTLFLAVETTTQIVFKYAGADLSLDDGLPGLIQHAMTSPWVPMAFLFYFAGFLIWMTILRDADLGGAYPLTALMYVTTLIAAVVLFHETLNFMRVLGVATIMAGVVILSRDEGSGAPDAAPGPSSGASLPAASHSHD